MDEFLPMRDYTDAFSVPDEKLPAFASSLLSRYKLVVTVGVSGTGKTTFLKHFDPGMNWTCTIWERDKIMEMIFSDGRRPDNFYGYLDRFESDVLPKVILTDYHRLFVAGWNRMSKSRKRYLSYLPKGLGRSCCLVFDGPIDLIIKRNIEYNLERFGRSREDLSLHLRQQYLGTQWPMFSEGFDDIIYINTFGDAGAKYLSEILY